MKSILISSVALLSISVGAEAADLLPVKAPPLPTWSWTGLYVGGEIGDGWAASQETHITGGPNFPTGFVEAPVHLSGVLGGVYGGYNYQINQYVLGIDGDYTWAHLTGSGTDVGAIGNTQHESDVLNWVATVTGRVGWANNNWLLFVKGGAAWAGWSTPSFQTTPTGALVNTNSASSTRNGWTVGVGAEWGFSPHLSAKLEYDYVGFATANYNAVVNVVAPPAVFIDARTATSSLNMVKAGLAYRF